MGASLAQALQTGTESNAAGLALENDIQLVFFHPNYVFRDGAERSGDAAAANFARRSPFPMINILRTPQVKAAQKGLPTGLVYEQNELTLKDIGKDLMADMLDDLDWSPMDGRKVDRQDIKVLKMARSMMADSAQKHDRLDLTGGAAERAANDAPPVDDSKNAECPFAARDEAGPNHVAPDHPQAQAQAAAPPQADYADWASAIDPNTGNTYYYNAKTGATSWDWPPPN